jgi:RNA polymerase sigma-70 factor (ECF subfamily)
MIYLVFNEGYTREVGGGGEASPLTTEAIRLGRMLLQLFPTEPEVMGLVALMLLAEARAPARFARDGSAVPLDRQDRTRWDRRLVAERLALVDKAMRHRQPGAYQVQAAISAVHARAARAEETDWRQIAILYAALEHMTRSPVVTLNRAVAVAKSAGPAEALALVEPLADELDGYFYFHGVRGSLLKDLGRSAEAREALGRAIGLAGSAAEAAHIRGELDQLAGEAGTAEKKS